MSRLIKHEDICKELTYIYDKKNADYGDSFGQLYNEFGPTSLAIRLSDKLTRFKTLIKQDAQVKDESIEDTLLDMANYCILGIMKMRKDKIGEDLVARAIQIMGSDETVEVPVANTHKNNTDNITYFNGLSINDITSDDLYNAIYQVDILPCGFCTNCSLNSKTDLCGALCDLANNMSVPLNSDTKITTTSQLIWVLRQYHEISIDWTDNKWRQAVTVSIDNKDRKGSLDYICGIICDKLNEEDPVNE